MKNEDVITNGIRVLEPETENTGNSHDRTLKFEVVTNEQEFSSLRAAWNGLVERCSGTVYQTHEWASCWWKHFGKRPGQSLCCLVMKAGNRVIGIAPLFKERISFAGLQAQTRLGFLGEGNSYQTSFGMFFDNGPSDYLDILVDPEFEQPVCAQFAEFLSAGLPGRIHVHLVNVPEQSVIRRALLGELKKRGVFIQTRQADICPYLTLPKSLDEYIGSMSASVRRRLQQARRAGSEEKMFTLAKPGTLAEYHQALDEITGLHQRRWNKMGFPGLFADARFTEFQHGIVDAFHANGWLWCKTASTESGCVASRLAFRFGDSFYDYLSGFDDAAPASKRRPGLALLLAMIGDGIGEKLRRVDFLRGDESYKFELTSSSRYNWNYTIEKGPRTFLTGIGTGILWLRFANFLMAREARLLEVQVRQRGFPGFVAGYIRFRTPRLRRKLKRMFRVGAATNSGQQVDHE